MAGVNKRKRGRKPKSDPASTADIPSTSPRIDDVVFSVSNVELIDPPASSTFHRPRRGRPRKIPNLHDSSNTENGKTLKVTSQNPTRRLIDKPNGNGVASLISSEVNAAVARVVPAMDAVVKVFCVHTEPNYSLPWQRKRQYSSNSSGFVIKGRRVLTNAHSVEHYTQVKLKKRGSDTKYLATVLAIGTECDIALLTVDGDEFWEGVSPVEFGDLPALQDAVTVVGYPIGGDTISVTSGVVSRIEILSYVHGSTELLGLQIDAAINSGNSGGPAFNDKGNCIGIAFQSLKHEDVENIGYVIPTPVIMHFIKDYEKNGSYTGFPILGVEWQKMENPDLRLSMGMKPDQKGVRIRRIDPTAPESMLLMTSDVILSFDGVDIANDGTVFKKAIRIYSYISQRPLLLNLMRKFTKQRNLVKPAKTRFATAFLTLQAMYFQRKNLKSLVISTEWTSSRFAKEATGKEIVGYLLSAHFWNNVVRALKICGPLVMVLRLVDGEKKPPMGYIYEAMDRAKESIEKAFNKAKKEYEKVFEIIDRRWNDQLHRPLHAAGFLLNPGLYYTAADNYTLHPEIMEGYFSCVEKMVPDVATQDLLLDELSKYKAADGMFGCGQAIRARDTRSPVPFRHGERIGFSYLVSQKYFGDSAAVKVLRRNSEILNVNIKLATQMRLIPAHNKGRPPSYYIIAGFVFTAVSVPYLRSEYGKDYEYEAPVKLLDKLMHEFRQSPDEQIVVVSQVLVADINIGYEEIVNTQVLTFNGEPVKNLKSLACMVEKCNDEFLKFDLEYQQVVVLQTKTAKSATSDILATHCIPSAFSEDLRM